MKGGNLSFKGNSIKSNWITIRTTAEEKMQIEEDTKKAGLDNVSAYLLQLYRKYRQ